jgi:hypothetical protein
MSDRGAKEITPPELVEQVGWTLLMTQPILAPKRVFCKFKTSQLPGPVSSIAIQAGEIYTEVHVLKFENRWTGAVSNIWSNPANWGCGSVPDANTGVFINRGNVIDDKDVIVRSLKINPDAIFTVSPGFTVTITH